MKIAMNENTIFQCEFIDFITACESAGFKSVEVSYAKIKEALKFISIKDLLHILSSKDISILSLNAFEDALLVPESNLKLLESESKYLAILCNMIQCPVVVIPSSRWYPHYGPLPEKDKITALYQERLVFIQQILAEHGIEAMFEPIAYPEFTVGDVNWINQILDIPSLKGLRLVPDIHNLYINGEGPEQLERLNNSIGIFHIDDTKNIETKELHVAFSRDFPGDGIAEAAKWIKSAERMGYTGHYSLELFDSKIYNMEPKKATLLCREKLDSFSEKYI